MKPTLHPSPENLSLFATGQLGGPEAAGIESHVNDCSECCDTLRHLAEDSFTALVRQAASAPMAPRPGDTPRPVARSLELEEAADSTLEIPDVLRGHPRYRVLEVLGQ